MSALENMLIGHHATDPLRHGVGRLGSRARDGARSAASEQEMMELLSFIGLADYADMPAGELSGGQRRLLALGRAIAMRPKLLMLDEPAAGTFAGQCRQPARDGACAEETLRPDVIIIEHILKVVMETCETVTVLEHGEKIAEGPPAEIKDDHRVIEAYLGKEMDDAEVRAFLQAS